MLIFSLFKIKRSLNQTIKNVNELLSQLPLLHRIIHFSDSLSTFQQWQYL